MDGPRYRAEVVEPDTELLAYLHSLGADEAAIAAADTTGHLPGLAADLVLARDEALTAADVAERMGVPVDDVVGVWRSLGVGVPDASARIFTEADAVLTERILAFHHLVANGDELLRVVGSGIGRIADAAIAAYIQTVEDALARSDARPIDFARESAVTAQAALGVGDGFGSLFRHHLRDAVHRQRLSQAGVAERALARLAVGFVDLVGFTALSRTLGPRQLIELLADFETRAFELATEHGSRVVKQIGDEIMFVALEPAAVCSTALALMEGYGDAGVKPRGGLAFGEVVTRHGDYFGSVVNLASRLTELAIPGEVLLTPEVAAAVGPDAGYEFVPGGRRMVKGFDEPIDVVSLARG